MSLADDFDALCDSLPDSWRWAMIHVTYERDEGELGGAQVEARRAAVQTLAVARAVITTGGLDLEVTPRATAQVYTGLRQLEEGGRRGQIEVVDLKAAQAEDLLTWNGPIHLRQGRRPVEVPGGYAFRLEVAA